MMPFRVRVLDALLRINLLVYLSALPTCTYLFCLFHLSVYLAIRQVNPLSARPHQNQRYKS